MDKRHYFGLFKSIGVSGLERFKKLTFYPKISLDEAQQKKKGVVYIKGLGDYFEELLDYQSLVREYIYKIDFNGIVGIYVCLGDYTEERRTDLNWYVEIIGQLKLKTGNILKFYLFSDGKDAELDSLLSLKGVERFFCGNECNYRYSCSK